jgi:hypothetical protein
MLCCSYYVVTIHGVYNATSSVESTVLLHYYVCSAQYGCFLKFLDFMLSRYVAQVFSKWFWDGLSCL